MANSKNFSPLKACAFSSWLLCRHLNKLITDKGFEHSSALGFVHSGKSNSALNESFEEVIFFFFSWFEKQRKNKILCSSFKSLISLWRLNKNTRGISLKKLKKSFTVGPHHIVFSKKKKSAVSFFHMC